MLLNKILHRPTARYRILRERMTEPIHLNLASLVMAACGSLRSKINFDLIQRVHYAYGVLAAADQAIEQNLESITIVEFGVAAGEGLLNLCELSQRVTDVTGIGMQVVGFDSGSGMPAPSDYRDHPEEFQVGDYPMDHDRLRSRLPSNCQLILGPVKETVPTFLADVPIRKAPLGFAAFDLDYYSSTIDALSILSDPDSAKYIYLPILYFDDVVLPTYNSWAGELLAIGDFNKRNELRKIEQYRFLRSRRILKNARWIDQIYLLHLFDHPWARRSRKAREMPNAYF
ncbi:MAG TPA: hypothetical protein VMA09_06375 [Candidatus Binataceae bacterium]|nr:hypothetical protein [Candidatus Binataceae bacterium]